jgi:positive regulator of sigma E activity
MLLNIIIKHFVKLILLSILWVTLSWRGRARHWIGIRGSLEIINNILRAVIVKINEINLIDLGVVVVVAEVLVMMMNMVLKILPIVFILIIKPLSTFVPRLRNFRLVIIFLFISVSFLWILSFYSDIRLVF